MLLIPSVDVGSLVVKEVIREELLKMAGLSGFTTLAPKTKKFGSGWWLDSLPIWDVFLLYTMRAIRSTDGYR
ncbi:hypothetical protein L6164_024026 [Bauhinia variegata]|uniref:Uncharacterized protein n=1 Tax=Bauhinia variegata TaxID=167791 RepID=A0ACB9LXR7_BAUVA|nr:hypothetical protein L6164_024026 [Bauhinia variegata]